MGKNFEKTPSPGPFSSFSLDPEALAQDSRLILRDFCGVFSLLR